MALDRTRIASDQAMIADTLEGNEEALRNARSAAQRYNETLKRAATELRSARLALRRAGYLK